MHDPLEGIAVVVVLGIACQVLGPRLRLPPILLLLVVGFLAGALHLVDADELLGELLFPVVSLAVGVILFEGGLTLEIAELRGGLRRTVRRLLSIGVVVTFACVAAAAYLLLDLPGSLAVLLGAILVVSGPTVVTPLLRFLGDVGRVGTVLKFEGILVDPIGAILAVLIFQAILAEAGNEDPVNVVGGFALTVGVGAAVGGLGAVALGGLLRLGQGTPQLDAPVTLALVLGALAAADALREESGLVAVTLMGVALANQRVVDLERIEQFKQTLGIVLISAIFILLSARLTWGQLTSVGWQGLVFVAVLILLVRPVAVALSTIGSELRWQERALLAWMGPRGIVAASVASVFALELQDAGVAEADRLVPVTFVVILGTVLVASLTVVPVAGLLGLRQTSQVAGSKR